MRNQVVGYVFLFQFFWGGGVDGLYSVLSYDRPIILKEKKELLII